MQKKLDNFKIIGILLLFLSFIDSYFLLKFETFSQLFWFCNSALYIIAFGFYFRKSIIITAALLGALVVQIPWVLDFLVQLFFGYSLFGVASYMFDYGFNDIRFYIELDHLLIIPLTLYGVSKLGFHKKAWIFAVIVVLVLNTGAYAFSSEPDNVNCVFFSCFGDEIKEKNLLYALTWTFLLVFAIFVLNQIINWLLVRRKFGS